MENWLLVAFIAPGLWSIVNLIDVYFVDGVYNDEYDGTIISGLLQLLPWFLVVFGYWEFQLPPHGAVLFFASGIFFISANFYYFRTLFRQNDASLVQILWNSAIPLTLLFSWIFLRDRLSPETLLGILGIFIGLLVLALPNRTSGKWNIRDLVLPTLGGSFFLSLSFVFSEHAYRISSTSFFNGYLTFTLGAAVAGVYFLVWRREHIRPLTQRIYSLGRHYAIIFLLAEMLAVTGTFTSQLAIDLSPSAALVMTVESLSPVFIMFFSLLIYLFTRLTKKHHGRFQSLYHSQFSGFAVKLVATAIVAVGVYMIGS